MLDKELLCSRIHDAHSVSPEEAKWKGVGENLRLEGLKMPTQYGHSRTAGMWQDS